MLTRILALALLVLTLAACARPNFERTVRHRETEIAEREAQIAALKDALQLERSRVPEAPPPSTSSLADDLADTGASVSARGTEVVISVENEILFASGSATLTAPAKRSLARIVQVINQRYPGYRIRVDGHTDNQPIVRTRDRWSDNWQLSGARSLAVLRELINAGISNENIFFAGWGEFTPKASNSTASGRSQNRRVDIVVLDASL